MTHWRYVERCTVRNHCGSFIAEARLHCHFEVGAICKTPQEAMESAAMKLALSRGWEDEEELL